MAQRIFFFLYGLLWFAVKPFLKKHKRLSEGYGERIVGGSWLELARKNPVSLWIQASSGGEAYLTLELLKHISAEHAGMHILCTSMTKQGMDVLQKGKQAFERKWQETHALPVPLISLCYFPFDDERSMQKAFSLARPKNCILLETELWPCFMLMCKKNGAALYVVNARMTDKTHAAYGKLKAVFSGVNPKKIFATREKDKEHYQEIFPQSECAFMHNMKFDGIYHELLLAMQEKKENPLQAVFDGRTCMYLFASVRREEEQELAPLIETLHRQKKKSAVCIAPRHVARFAEWKRILQEKGLNVRFVSDIFAENDQIKAGDIVVWDRFGDLKKLYALTDYAVVGGSFAPLGGQNFLEPLAYGIVPHTGVHLHNFLWVFEKREKNLAEENLLYLHSSVSMLAKALLAQPEKKFTQHAEIQECFKIWLKPLIGGTKTVMEEILKNISRC